MRRTFKKGLPSESGSVGDCGGRKANISYVAGGEAAGIWSLDLSTTEKNPKEVDE